jgi:hypothetical protein
MQLQGFARDLTVLLMIYSWVCILFCIMISLDRCYLHISNLESHFQILTLVLLKLHFKPGNVFSFGKIKC